MSDVGSFSQGDRAVSAAAGPVVRVLGGVVFGLGILFGLEEIYNYDLWWHLRTGHWILEHGRVPRVDPFTFTVPGAPWLPHYWLSDAVLAATDRILGLEGVVLLKAAVIAGALVLLFRLLVRGGTSPFLAVALILLAILIGRFRFLLRPHVVAFPLALASFGVLSRWKPGSRRILWIPVIALVWGNLHGSAGLAVALTACLAAEGLVLAGLARIRGTDGAGSRVTVPAVVTVAATAALCVNPFGTDLLGAVSDLVRTNALTRSLFVEEFRRLAWGEHRLFWALMLVTGASFAVAGRRARIYHVLVWILTSALAVQSVRFVALAGFLQIAILGDNLVPGLRALARTLGPRRERLLAAAAVPTLAVAAVALFQSVFAESRVYRFGIGVNESRFPVAAVERLKGLEPSGNTYNSWELGGYLLWARPGHPVFLDGRHLGAQVAFMEILRSMSGTEVTRLLAQLDVRSALVWAKDRRFASHFREDQRFRLVYFDDQAYLYLRDDALEPETLDSLPAFRLLAPERTDIAYLAHLARTPRAEDLEGEIRRAIRESPGSFKARFFLAVYLEAVGRKREAVRAYADAAEVNPRLAFVHYRVGRRGGNLAMQLGMWDEAIRLLSASLEMSPGGEKTFLLATALYSSGRLAEAEDRFEELLDREPDQVDALVNLGFLYIDTDRPGRAQRLYARALRADPEREAAWYGSALALERSGRVQEAVAAWTEFLRRFPESRWAPNARSSLAGHGSVPPSGPR